MESLQDLLSVREKLTACRIWLSKVFPFFSYLLHFLEIEEVDWMPYPTFATDGKKFFYDVRAVEEWDLEEINFGIGHEIIHIVQNHPGRRGSRDKNIWHAAIDFATNAILMQQKSNAMRPPRGILYDPEYIGKSAEEIYDILVAKGYKPTGKPFDVHMEGQISSEWRSRAYGAYNYARGFNSVPAGIDLFFKQLTEPEIDWRIVLANFVNQFSRDDYSWSRPNRQHLYRGIIMPSCHVEEIGTVAVKIDTSGSIDQKQRSKFLSEVQSIRDSYPMEMLLIACDAEVQNVYAIEKFGQFDISRLKIKGGGGTDFRPAFNYVRENGIEPAVGIYFTDGKGTYPETAPNYPVMWVLTRDNWKPPFGECVVINA